MRCLIPKRNVKTTFVMSVRHRRALRMQTEQFIHSNESTASLSVLDARKHLLDRIIWIYIGKCVWRRTGLKVINPIKLKTNSIVDIDEEDLIVQYLRYDGEYNLAVCIKCEYGLPREWIASHFKKVHKLSVFNSWATNSDLGRWRRKELNGLQNGIWIMTSRLWKSVKLGRNPFLYCDAR